MRIKQREDYDKQRKRTSDMNKVEMADAHAAKIADINFLVISVILCKRKCSKRRQAIYEKYCLNENYCLVAGKPYERKP